MLKKIVIMGTLGLLILHWHSPALAEPELQLPKEELSTESVLPVFDKPVSVKNRNIITAKKWDSDLFYSYAMTEPIANVSKVGFSLHYNNSENHAWGFWYAKNFAGLSSYADQLNSQYGLDFTRAPQPQNTYLLDYNVKAYYGKMSFTKDYVLNTSLHGSVAAGMVQYSYKSFPAVVLGIGEKFYFNKSWALRFDLRLYANQAPIPFIKNGLKPSDPVPNPDQFTERLTYTTTLDAGLSYLF